MWNSVLVSLVADIKTKFMRGFVRAVLRSLMMMPNRDVNGFISDLFKFLLQYDSFHCYSSFSGSFRVIHGITVYNDIPN